MVFVIVPEKKVILKTISISPSPFNIDRKKVASNAGLINLTIWLDAILTVTH